MPKKIDLQPVLEAVEPQEAIDFFRQKGYRIGFDYRDVWRQEHQAAFTVAKAMQVDLLQAIRQEVDKALASGSTLADFRQELEPFLVKRGWWGKQEMTDPLTGERKLAQLGSPRRLQVIFDTNLATAYSEGQWERIQASRELFPFLMYDGLNSAHPREQHRPWDGLVLRADDPWWESHMPIKAYGCKCTVVQLTRRMMAREGYKEGKAPPEQYTTYTNRRTGEVQQVPQGVHPAFNYPYGGRQANLQKMLADKQLEVNSYRAATFAQSTRAISDRQVALDLGPLAAPAAIRSALGRDLAGFSAELDNYAVRHTLRQHGHAQAEAARGQLPVEPDDFGMIPLILAAPDGVHTDGQTRQGREVLVFTRVIAGVGYWLVQELRPGRKTMALVSLRKKHGAWGADKPAE